MISRLSRNLQTATFPRQDGRRPNFRQPGESLAANDDVTAGGEVKRQRQLNATGGEVDRGNGRKTTVRTMAEGEQVNAMGKKIVYFKGAEVELPASDWRGGVQLYLDNKSGDFAGALKALRKVGILDPNARVNFAGHWWDDPWTAFNGYTLRQIERARTLSEFSAPLIKGAYAPSEICGVPLGGNIGAHWPIHSNISSAGLIADNMKAIGAGYSNVMLCYGQSPDDMQTIATELKKRGITPVARIYTKEPVGKWVIPPAGDTTTDIGQNTFLQMLDTAKKAYSAGFQLIQVGGNETNIGSETGLPEGASLTPEHLALKETYLNDATRNIVEAVKRTKAELPEAKIGSPAMIAGPQDSSPHEYNCATFLQRLAEAYRSAGVKPDWSATHTFCWAGNYFVSPDYPGQNNYTIMPPMGSGEGTVLGVPELSTEGGGFEHQPDAMLMTMREAFRHAAQGKTQCLWLDYGPGYQSSPLNGGNVSEGTGLGNYKDGLEFYRSCYEIYRDAFPPAA